MRWGKTRGGAGVQRNLGTQCRLHELNNKRRISVAGASKLLANTLFSYRGMGLSMGTMIAGWDEKEGPSLYYVDSEGQRIKGERFSVGSGSLFAYGVLDQGYRCARPPTPLAAMRGSPAPAHATRSRWRLHGTLRTSSLPPTTLGRVLNVAGPSWWCWRPCCGGLTAWRGRGRISWELTDAEACELGRKAIYHATFRDAYSGGTVSVYHVTKQGWTKVSGDDVGELHYHYNPAD
jgi:hypothetical protein